MKGLAAECHKRLECCSVGCTQQKKSESMACLLFDLECFEDVGGADDESDGDGGTLARLANEWTHGFCLLRCCWMRACWMCVGWRRFDGLKTRRRNNGGSRGFIEEEMICDLHSLSNQQGLHRTA